MIRTLEPSRFSFEEIEKMHAIKKPVENER